MNMVYWFRLCAGFTFGVTAMALISSEGSVAGGIISLLMALVNILPLIIDRRKQQRRPSFSISSSIAGVKSMANGKNVSRLFRWFMGFICGIGAIGSLVENEVQVVLCIAFLFLYLILTPPADAMIFLGNRSPAPVVIIRNVGLLMFVSALGHYFNKNITPENKLEGNKGLAQASVLWVIGAAMLLLPPVISYFKYGTFVLPLPPEEPEPAPVTPLSVFSSPATPPPVTASPVAPPTPVATPTTPPAAPTIPETPPPGVVSLQILKEEFAVLETLAPQKRGYGFQDFLNKLFAYYDLAPRGAFRLKGEEIDGSFEINGQIYLLEAKWQAKPCNQADLMVFNSKVESKSTWARGIFVSYASFTSQALEAFARGKRTSIIGMNGEDLAYILEGNISLVDAIRLKARRAVETNDFFVSLKELKP